LWKSRSKSTLGVAAMWGLEGLAGAGAEQGPGGPARRGFNSLKLPYF
jgi:hypothetical protein